MITKEDVLATIAYFANTVLASLYILSSGLLLWAVVWFVLMMALPYILDGWYDGA